MVALFMALALLAFAAQFVIDFTPDNIAASCIVLASSLAILLYILWTQAIQTHPLSTFAIFGFCVTSQLGALLAQSASGVSLTHNLRQPLDTFAWLALFQGTAMLSHALYRTFSKPQEQQRPNILRAMLQRFGLYTPPTVGTLWMLGLIGLCGQLLGSISQGAVGKIGQSFAFVAWAPFLIPMFAAEMGRAYCDKKRNYTFLFIYIGLIALLALAANARGMMLSGLMTISIFFMLRALRSLQRVTALQVGKFALLGLLVAGLSIPLSDLMVAMSIARNSRATATPMKMVEDTFYYVTQPDKLKAARESATTASRFESYDETYFDNPLLGRLMETKFHDNAMYFATRLSERDQDRLWDITGDFLWTTLPDPALKALKIKVDKDAMRFTMGDYLSHMGGAGDLGGYKTGSGFGHGLAMFGIYFPLIYFFICPILFMAVDVLSYRAAQGCVFVSALGMLGIWKMFQYGITTESLQGFFMYVVRGVPQNILMYLLTLWIARTCANALATLLGSERKHPARNRLVPG
ncbi:hypothetical protein DIC66_16580 [Rhodoferax lacus]|uniref:O-antigen polysaccharide polymerase Wzy n=2 Tax=Rhodoferax lacus TaxID=2184758 RepID=A0A3E1R9V1_9BURK|nr:hypothetical protein DIC66_16580 [Rhodoferax lacus]